MKPSGDRERLGETFEQAAEIYDRARPDYPDELFEALISVTRLPAGARLLEIGCGTGKATLPFARRGFSLTCLEPGPQLAALAREKLECFDVEIVDQRFEDWAPNSASIFDLVFAATAWHWVDPGVGCRKAWQALRPEGHLALWSALHVFPADGDAFFREIQDVYEEIGEGLPPDAGWPRPGELPDQSEEINATDLFWVIHTQQFDWELTYDADGYIDLLNTFSGHIAMEDWKRERLYGEIRSRLSLRPHGAVRRHWGVVLRVARRVN